MNSVVKKAGSMAAENVISKLAVLEMSLMVVAPNFSTPSILNDVIVRGSGSGLVSSEHEKIISKRKTVRKNRTIEVKEVEKEGFPFPETLRP